MPPPRAAYLVAIFISHSNLIVVFESPIGAGFLATAMALLVVAAGDRQVVRKVWLPSRTAGRRF
jgi:hypothetical protein